MNRLGLFSLGFALVVSTSALSAQDSGPANDVKAIRALYQRFTDAFNRRDVAAIMSLYLPGKNLFVFDVTPPRQHMGWDDYKKDWQDLFAAFPGALHQDLSDLSITSDGKLAFSHYMVGGYFTRADGSKLAVTVRSTDALRKMNGKWLIVEEHVSVPVDLDTGKADLLSKP